MLTLVTFPAFFGEPSASPFCVKVMCLLKMAGVDWQPEWQGDPRKGPKQKLPVLLDGDKTIADSHFIRLHLEESLGIDFDEGLNEEQRAISLSLTRMAEEHLYWGIVHDRWMKDDNWSVVGSFFFSQVPAFMRGFISNSARKQVRSDLNGHGLGRHSHEEVARLVREDLEALDAFLGDKAFLMGDAPKSVDASVAPLIAGILGSPHETATVRNLKSMPKLMAYVERAREALYPEV